MSKATVGLGAVAGVGTLGFFLWRVQQRRRLMATLTVHPMYSGATPGYIQDLVNEELPLMSFKTADDAFKEITGSGMSILDWASRNIPGFKEIRATTTEVEKGIRKGANTAYDKSSSWWSFWS